MELKRASHCLTLIEYESMAGSSNFSGDVLKWVTLTWHFNAATVGIQQKRALRFRRLHESRISTFYSGHASAAMRRRKKPVGHRDRCPPSLPIHTPVRIRLTGQARTKGSCRAQTVLASKPD